MKPGFVPFWTDDTPTAPDEARAFCKSRGLTPDQVKIVRRDGAVMVEVKKTCQLKLGQRPT